MISTRTLNIYTVWSKGTVDHFFITGQFMRKIKQKNRITASLTEQMACFDVFLSSRAALDRKLIILGDQPHSKLVSFLPFILLFLYRLAQL